MPSLFVSAQSKVLNIDKSLTAFFNFPRDAELRLKSKTLTRVDLVSCGFFSAGKRLIKSHLCCISLRTMHFLNRSRSFWKKLLISGPLALSIWITFPVVERRSFGQSAGRF